MTELLKRWAQHEPERCAFWTEFDNPMCRVFVNRTDVASYELEFRPMLLAAVIEAIEARRLGWAVIRANGVDGITGMVEGGDVARTSVSPDPAEALLTAYLRFLDDQVVP